MSTIDEKRVYAAKEGREVVLVATDLGVASVAVSADQIGRFGLAHQCAARDVAARPGEAAVATDDGVLRTRGEDEFEHVGFEAATAVGYGTGLFAAAEDGRIVEYADGDWVVRGRVDGDVRAIDGDLVAATGGVFRITADGVAHAGLDDARDVAASGPYAATESGLFRLGNGWLDELDAPTDAVAADGDRAHAVAADRLYERTPDGWRERDPADGVVDVAHGADAVYAVTEDARFIVNAGDGWRGQRLGLRGVRGVAVP